MRPPLRLYHVLDREEEFVTVAPTESLEGRQPLLADGFANGVPHCPTRPVKQSGQKLGPEKLENIRILAGGSGLWDLPGPSRGARVRWRGLHRA